MKHSPIALGFAALSAMTVMTACNVNEGRVDKDIDNTIRKAKCASPAALKSDMLTMEMDCENLQTTVMLPDSDGNPVEVVAKIEDVDTDKIVLDHDGQKIVIEADGDEATDAASQKVKVSYAGEPMDIAAMNTKVASDKTQGELEVQSYDEN